jgi:hypothetical protein
MFSTRCFPLGDALYSIFSTWRCSLLEAALNGRLTPDRYKPAPTMLGWHIGLWNLIGGIGFTVCPALGFGAQDSAGLAYASGLSTFIGSWAFLVRCMTVPPFLTTPRVAHRG